MTTLTRAVAIGDTELKIDAQMSNSPFPGFVKIGDEWLSVGGAEYRPGTTLALSEAARATHADGSTVTYAGRFIDPTFAANAFSAGGGALTVTDGTTTVEASTLSLTPGFVTDQGAGVAGLAVSGPVYFECNVPPEGAGLFAWDSIYDAAQQPLVGIPATLGLAFGTGGTDETRLDATETGIWAVTLFGVATLDDTAISYLQLVTNDYIGTHPLYLPQLEGGNRGSIATVIQSVAAADVLHGATTSPNATASPYTPISYAVLKVVRLA